MQARAVAYPKAALRQPCPEAERQDARQAPGAMCQVSGVRAHDEQHHRLSDPVSLRRLSRFKVWLERGCVSARLPNLYI